MEKDAQPALVDAVLERAAEQLGDMTEAVFALYYARQPEARGRFLHHDPFHPHRLEGSMVEQTIYSLMRWHESPGEIEIIMFTTLPHHIETLGVSHDMFAALLIAVCDVIASTIPADARAEAEAWADLRQTLLELIATAASHALP